VSVVGTIGDNKERAMFCVTDWLRTFFLQMSCVSSPEEVGEDPLSVLCSQRGMSPTIEGTVGRKVFEEGRHVDAGSVRVSSPKPTCGATCGASPHPLHTANERAGVCRRFDVRRATSDSASIAHPSLQHPTRAVTGRNLQKTQCKLLIWMLP
jgi:hypothetical protein